MKNIKIIKANERGYFDHDWLKTYHTFSFADYYNPNLMGFSSLRVINDDKVKSSTGFSFHPHQNMEIITYILDGTLTHQDSIGNKEEIEAGCFQVMSAGSGIVHSEWNYGDKDCHLLQIWIRPEQYGGEPYYKIYKADLKNKWALIVSSQGDRESFSIRQNAELYCIESDANLTEIKLPNNPYYKRFIHLAEGEIKLINNEANSNDIALESGDAICFTEKNNNQDISADIKIEFIKNSKILLFNLL